MADLGSFVTVTERPRPIQSSVNRYDIGYQLYDGTFLYDAMQLRVDVPTAEDDLYHDVTAGEVGKLDVISAHYYGTPYLWWLIALANNILNPLRVEAGTRLRIPSLDVLPQVKV